LCNHCCSGKAVSVTYSEYVFVVLGIQHSMRMRHIVICGMFGSTIFFHTIYKGHDFREKKKLLDVHVTCLYVFSLKLLSETFVILRTIQQDIVTNVHCSARKVPVILVIF